RGRANLSPAYLTPCSWKFKKLGLPQGGRSLMESKVIEILLMFVKAFVVGGSICTLAQIIINFTDLTAGKILVYFMLAGVVLTAIGVYQPLVDFAGAGATVPISGFGYLLANGAIKGAEKGFFYAVTGSLAAASAGITAAVVFSFIMALIFKAHTKKN
ncbi:MAG: SpoVA/SpoVAEb family sporulation membrane protein, partial [Candidatus Coproplasma sp.]